MVFSMCGLMLKLKWCAWIAVYCSFISFAQLPQLRGHQADDEQLHALHLGRGDVLPAEPTAHVPPVVTVAGGGDPRGVSGWGNKGVLRPSRGAWTVRGCWGHQGVLR
ncbi:PAT complex subunit Asterix isoform X1 [Phaenicophaeus curvirostris]|uniref:PAT complex subunit Asterix isoform X1 n=1 Tax=Phaenicophaeus curvirostris TaxID=33595 RepID=UPI0037F0BCF3